MTAPERKPRCLKLVSNGRGVNRCESEQLPGTDLCGKHLAAAVADFRRITQDAVAEIADAD